MAKRGTAHKPGNLKMPTALSKDPVALHVRGEMMRKGNQPGPTAGKAVNKKTNISGATAKGAGSKGSQFKR